MEQDKPGRPVAAAQSWLRLIRDGDIREAWQEVEGDTRLALAQAWIIANESHPNLLGHDRDQLAGELADAKPTAVLARAFLATQLNEFQRAFQAFDEETWGAAEKPRLFGLDYELVIFMRTGGGIKIWQSGTEESAIQLLLRRQLGRWYISNFVAAYVVPGWPPTSKALPSD